MAGLCEGGNEPKGSLKAIRRCSANDNSAYRCSANDKSALYHYKTASIDYSRICNRKRISEKSRRLEIQYCRRRLYIARRDVTTNVLSLTLSGIHDCEFESHLDSACFSAVNIVSVYWLRLWLSARALVFHTDDLGLIRGKDEMKFVNQSDSLMTADGDCHHLCKLMAPVRHRWSISDVIVEIRNIVMPSDCSALRFGIRS
ncbi:hypothetical protein ANN_05705 [Periplaneta americana]|uniref:Uncharacterized protein n=1 Tax=Periplaneta americana TaxID=6978 RepID=A0ABQ8TCF4_PERAM|nr:hypothetical protein ANN_05705 [Periplaneta americana]